MNLASLLPYINEYGYLALYLILWIGFFGVPVPNEVIVMTSGLIANKSVMQPVWTFIITYLGVISSLTTLYCIGRFGNKLKGRKKKVHALKLQSAKRMIERHGAFSLVISYYFPTARHLIPLILGSNKFPFKTFVIFSYTNAFLWTFLYFFIGYEFGAYINLIGSAVYSYGWYGLAILVIIVGILNFKKFPWRKRIKENYKEK